MNPLLFGHNTDERIVAVHQKDDNTMRVYVRDGPATRHEDVHFYPFFFLSDTKYLEGFTQKHWLKKLSGSGYYSYLCAVEDWTTMWEAVRFIMERYNQDALKKIDHYTELDCLFLYTDAVTQYLMQTGRTMFKGMTFEDLHRLQLDIETYASGTYKFSSSGREADRIIVIALSDNRGWHHLINGKQMSEQDMLLELTRVINQRDPDIIEGHNILSFDLPYIFKRCELHNVPLSIGRDGTPPKALDVRTAPLPRLFPYSGPEIAGRHIADTLLLVQSYDMVKRSMESYGLKYAAKYFGIASPNRTYIKGDKISWQWDHDVEPLLKYALDDVMETRKLGDLLSGSTFYLTQMLPFGYGTVLRLGAAAKIESLIVREYLRQKHSLPRPSEGFQTTGGYTNIFATGILGPVVHVDVESLYPSIMIRRAIAPGSDRLQVFLQLLNELTNWRLATKKTMRLSTDPAEQSRLDAMQSSLKILINAFYGYLGYSRGLFNDYSQADAVTQIGQSLLKQMIQHIQSEQGQVIEVDTDGIFFVPPPHHQGDVEEQRFVDELAHHMPEGIMVAMDGRYQKMVSYKKKNYALLGYDSGVKIKGSSLVSRSMERFGRVYIQECIKFLLRDDFDGLHRLYNLTRQRITSHAWDVRDFARTERLNDSLAEYARNVDAARRNRSAAYELAIASAKNYKIGDRVSYYITGNDANLRSFENCKAAEEWNPMFPDENVPFFLRRLDEFADKLQEFFSAKDYRAIFSVDDLFPFQSGGITVLTRSIHDVTNHPAQD